MSNNHRGDARDVCKVGALALALLALAASDTPARSAEIELDCESLKQIVSQAPNDFNDIVGQPMGPDTWEVTRALPGQESCRVERTAHIAYRCQSAKYPGPQEADTASKALASAVERCLGRRWERNTMMEEFFIGLSEPELGVQIIIDTEQDGPFPEHFVTTSISRKNQQRLEKPLEAEASKAGQKFCPDLKSMVDAGRQSFGPLIEGQQAEELNGKLHWRSNVMLAGWEDCWVHGNPGKPRCRYASCSRGPFLDDEEAQSIVARVADDVQLCLGGNWTIGKSRHATDGTVSRRIVGATEDAYVEVRQTKSLYSSAWTVKLDVSLDLEACP